MTQEILQQARHEAGTNILEGQGGTMEEFQGVDILALQASFGRAVLDLDHRAGELQGVVYQVLQTVQVNIVAKEGTGHIEGNVLKRHVRHVGEELLGQLVNHFGHIESAVFGQAFYHGLAQVSHRGFSIGAIVFHIVEN